MEAEYPEDEALLAASQVDSLEAALPLLNRECELCTTVMNIKEVKYGTLYSPRVLSLFTAPSPSFVCYDCPSLYSAIVSHLNAS